MKGKKFDSDKPKMSLIPAEALIEVGRVFSFGAKKYGDHNWRQGIEFSRLSSASTRHMLQFLAGENLDPESEIYHIAHSCANCLMLLQLLIEKRSELDDRYKPERVDGSDNQ